MLAETDRAAGTRAREFVESFDAPGDSDGYALLKSDVDAPTGGVPDRSRDEVAIAALKLAGTVGYEGVEIWGRTMSAMDPKRPTNGSPTWRPNKGSRSPRTDPTYGAGPRRSTTNSKCPRRRSTATWRRSRNGGTSSTTEPNTNWVRDSSTFCITRRITPESTISDDGGRRTRRGVQRAGAVHRRRERRGCLSLYGSGGDGGQNFVHVGYRNQLYHTAVEKAILVFMPPEKRDRIVENTSFEPLTRTERTITDETRLRDELERIREEGIAFNHGETISGLVGVGAPIHDQDGRLYGAISVIGPARRMEGDRLETDIPELGRRRSTSSRSTSRPSDLPRRLRFPSRRRSFRRLPVTRTREYRRFDRCISGRSPVQYW